MSHQQPPQIITWLIERLTTARESEIILGDMHEEYDSQLAHQGKFRADLNYTIDFISLLFHRVLRKKESSSNMLTMFTNYFKIAYRQLWRQKMHNAINIFGLALGLAVSLLIGLFVLQEQTFDKFHTKGDRIYLLPMTWKFGTTHMPIAGTTSAAGPLMKELFPEVETYTRITTKRTVFNHQQDYIEESEVIAVDSTFFDVFTFPMLVGNPARAVVEPYSIVLTEKSAVKYFGAEWRKNDILSKAIVAQNGKSYQITGVLKDIPIESHLRFDMLMSMSSLSKKVTEPNWDVSSMVTYVLLHPNASAKQIVEDIPLRVAAKYGADQNNYVELDLIPLHHVYLHNPKYAGLDTTSDIRYVYVFSAIAALVLIIAIINYMNLSTARSMERAKEVGVRKVIGAVRRELFWQFMSESLLVSFMAILLAVGLAYMALPLFNETSGKMLTLGFLKQPRGVGILIGFWLLIGIAGGVYPAAILSSFRPVATLKGKLAKVGSGAFLRKSLVVFQFSISIFLVICTLTIGDQLTYMVNTNVGVSKEQLITIQMDSVGRRNMNSIQNEFASIAGVTSSTAISAVPVNIGGKSTIVGGAVGDKQIMINNVGVGPEFVETSGLQIVSGSDFSQAPAKDGSWEFIINESAIAFIGLTPENAIGSKFSLWGKEGVVKGVVKDFHFSSLHKPIEALVIHMGSGNDGGFLGRFLVRLQSDSFESTIAAMNEKWKAVVPSSPFTFQFVNEQYYNLYKSERQLTRIMNVFSTLAIVIAALGLFGLASYTISQRTKELGIRKVLGASLPGLLVMVSGNFVKPVIIALLIAAPLSWFAMDSWLQNFAYPVGFSWMLVFISGIAAIVVALATVLYHAFEAARVNPANTLRSE